MRLIVEGKLYDQTGPDVLEHIQNFIDTYQLPLDELLVADLAQYPVGLLALREEQG